MKGLFLEDIGLDFFNAQSNPAAGADFTMSVGGTAGVRAQLLAIAFTLTTDATAANRRVQLLITNGQRAAVIPYIVAQAAFVQTATLAVRYFFSPGYGDSPDTVNGRALVRLPFPPELLSSSGTDGWAITSDVENIQAADQISDIEVYARAAIGI